MNAFIVIPWHTIVAGYYGFTLLSVFPSARPSVVRPSVFSFPDDNLNKCQRIFTKLGIYIDIVKIWFGITNGQFSSIFDEVIYDTSVFLFPADNLSNFQIIFTKLGVHIGMIEIWLGNAYEQFS